MRILIAEDHDATRLILEAAVRSLGRNRVARYEKAAILLPPCSQAFGADTGVVQRSSLIGTD